MDDPLPPNPYTALGVAKDANLAAIRSVYRKLVLTCHPDKVQDAALKIQMAEKFHQVQQAYEILSDDTRRRSYDDRARLSVLRAEMAERGASRRSYSPPPFTRAKTSWNGPSPVYESPIYEVRVPKAEGPRRAAYTDDDYFSSKAAPSRPTYRKSDDRHASFTRKPSGRAAEEKRRARDIEEEQERALRKREMEKAAEASANAERRKKREKDRRRESDFKSSRKNAYVEDFSDSDSSFDERAYSRKYEATPRRKQEETRKRDRRDGERTSAKHDEYEFDDGLDAKIHSATDYISKTPLESQSRRGSSPIVEIRPRHTRAASTVETRAPPATPPLPPRPIEKERERERRASARGRGGRDRSPVRSSGKSKRTPEIASPPPTPRPTLKGISSDPRGLERQPVSSPRREPVRAATVQSTQKPANIGLKRAETMPVKSSGLRHGETHVHDSGYGTESSDVSDSPPPLKPTKYVVAIDDDDEATVVYQSPDELKSRRSREEPSKSSRRSERPEIGGRGSSSRKAPLPRSQTFREEPSPKSRPTPTLSRTESARPPPLQSRQSSRRELFGEVSPPDTPYRIVNQSPKIRVEDARFADYSPYGSRRGSEEISRDSYPGSTFETHKRPSHGRSDTRVA